MSNPRIRLDVDARRAQLLEHALTLFSAKTFDEVSVADVARAAGVSQGLLYHYFPGKRALFLAALESAADRLVSEAIVTSELPAHAGAAERYASLRAGLDHYLRWVEQRAVAYRFLLRGGFGSDPDVAAVVSRTRDAFVDRIREGLGAGPDDPTARCLGIGWAAMVEVVSLEWLETADLTRCEVVEVLSQAAARLFAPLVMKG